MKYAWWVIVGLMLFLFCTQSALAYEGAGFDPTAEYVVHSVPMFVDDPVTVQFDQTPSDNFRKNPRTPHSKPAAPDDSSLADSIYTLPKAETKTATDLTSLTYAGQQRQQSIWSQVASSISSAVSSVSHRVVAAIKASVSALSSAVSTSVVSTSSVVKKTAFSAVISLSSLVNKVAGGLTYFINREISFIRKHVLAFALLSVGGPALVVLFSTPVGKAVTCLVVQSGVTGIVSAADLVLHAGCYVVGMGISLKTGSTVIQGYEKSKMFILKKTGHDIGTFSNDVKVVAVRIVLIAVILITPIVFAEAVEAAGTIATLTGPEVVLRANMSLSKTANDCSSIPGQCETIAGAGITAGSNFLFGAAPSAQLIEDEGKGAAKLLGNIGDDLAENKVLQTSLTTQVVKPTASNSKLQNIVNNLYKGVDNPLKVGSGTTSDAIRNELATGEPTHGTFHSQKGEESVRALQKWIRNNPDSNPADIELANNLIDDLLKALSGK